jgi:oligopeptide/dipeptide ABC transporter ATP-binding protein
MGLIQRPGKIAGGEIIYNWKGKLIDLAKLKAGSREMRAIRGGEIAMVFQEPMTSLDPVYTVGNQIIEAIRLHQSLGRKEAREKAIEMLKEVGISTPEQRVDEYPHQLSGGMRQRTMIAMALSCKPSLLIADEPTTALDVTIQAQVLDLMVKLRKEFKTSIIMISHNLGVIAEMADEVVVMYVGRGVEISSARNIFRKPKHPYTIGLMESVPSIISESTSLRSIKGVVPDPLKLPPGCSFEPRCPEAKQKCSMSKPPLAEVDPNHWVSCWLYE